MNLSIRQHIMQNFKGDNYDGIKSAIEESVNSEDEVVLPGMGVFFEIVWQAADQEMKNKILELIEQRIKNSNKND